ncbi:MAG: alpha-L-rhamnosidase [Bacteroidaceae bacterium]|nr:alpha-L-rhamnosidase [Bacteroidaceae bacterium]
MKRTIFSLIALVLTCSLTIIYCLKAEAQEVDKKLYLPLTFGNDILQMRQDRMTRVYIAPKKILWSQGIVRNLENLLDVDNGQADLVNASSCFMQRTKEKDASIILDYGRELHGALKLVVGSGSAANFRMRIRLGESVSETCSEIEGGTATNDHATRDIVLTVPRYGQIEIGNSGFRFARIDLLDEASLYLKEATAVFRYRNIPYLGTFQCSDNQLNDIWNTGAYTVQLNMQEYIWDGIKRDRLIWLGDMHPETNTISTVFGDEESFYASLDLAIEQYPLPNWFNSMSAYSMWYLIIQYDWYRHFGNLDFLKKHANYILGLIDLIDSCVEEDGSEHLADSRFLDWPSSPNKEGVEAGYRALLCWALQDGRQLCSLLGNDEKAQKCIEIENRLKKKVLPPNNLKQAAALMAIAGLMEPEKAAQDFLLPGGPKGFSTFYGYYMLEALAMAGHYEEAMDIIRKFWGGMLNMGATTFWEDFDLDWTKNAGRIDELVPKGKDDIHGDFGDYCYVGYRHSLCHGWASGPTAWLSNHVLGVEILEPGCKKVRITPHLGNLQWAKGTYPTPYGQIKVHHQKMADGTVKSSIEVPKGVKVVK